MKSYLVGLIVFALISFGYYQYIYNSKQTKINNLYSYYASRGDTPPTPRAEVNLKDIPWIIPIIFSVIAWYIAETFLSNETGKKIVSADSGKKIDNDFDSQISQFINVPPVANLNNVQVNADNDTAIMGIWD